MFGFFKPKQGVVTDHWYTLVPNFNTSGKEFYDAIETELKARQVPGLEIFRVDFAEGGVLSHQREYLRLTRERLVFDICAAPFGTAYFFSCRYAELPAVIKLWQILVLFVALLVGLPLSFAACVKLFDSLAIIIWPVGAMAAFTLAIYTLRNAVALGLNNLDVILVDSPVFGPIYENWFRKETYYRIDTRIMYRDTVNEVVQAKVEETTGAKGIKQLQFNKSSPILGELYKPTTVQLPPAA